MSELYDPKFDRKKFGNYDKNKAFTSVVGGTDSYFLEDEFNEMQWMQNEARAALLRTQYYSGIYKRNDINKAIMVADSILRPNFFAFNNMTAIVNGYLVEMEGSLGFLDNTQVIKKPVINNVILTAPPTEGIRYDLVYLEMWFSELNFKSDIWKHGNLNNYEGLVANDLFDNRVNGETCRRIQLQWAVRTVPGVSLSGVGFDESLNATLTPAFGGYTAQSNYGFWRADKALDGKTESNDLGLWIAGKGIPGDMNTVNGYSYAIPLFKVIRRNSSPYQDFNRNGGTLFVNGQASISDRPDGKFSNIIYEDDIIDLRNTITIGSDGLNKVLERNFSKLMVGELSGLAKPKTYTTYFGIDPLVPQTDTKLYLNCNRTMSYNSITPTIVGPSTYVPGVEQEAIHFDSYNSKFTYDLAFPLDRVTIQMIMKCDGLDNKDLFSIRNDEKEILSCCIYDGKLVVEDLTHPGLISIDLYSADVPKIKGEFVHLGLSWSKSTQKMYLTLNNKIMATVDITSILTKGQFKYFVLGYSDKAIGAMGTIIDELEIAARFTTSFSQLPIDFVQGDAKLAIDVQKGRRDYTFVSSKSTLTKHSTYKTDNNGQIIFSMNSPVGGTFTNSIPKMYFDNEAVEVTNVTWTGLNTNILQCTVIGLGPSVYYNFVIVYEIQYTIGQGLTDLPQKMHKVTCEETANSFIPVRSDKLYEEHFIDRAFQVTNAVGSTLDRFRAYKPGVHEKLGFCTAIKCYVRATGTETVKIPKTLYGQEITTVYNVGIADDLYNDKLLIDMDMSAANEITLVLSQKVAEDVSLEIILGTTLPNVTYNYIAGGIENLAKVEKVQLHGDGVSKEFIYRSESRILSSSAAILGTAPKYVAFVDGKLAMLDVNIIDTFIAFNFVTVPANKANIVVYIVSEYEPLRSERIKVWYEMLEYQGSNNMSYVTSFDNTAIECHPGSIFVTTDGINMPVDTRLNKNVMSTAYLPICGDIDTYLVPTKIAGNSTCMRATINYAEANSNDFNDQLPYLTALQLDLVQQTSGRGYTGFASVDNKSLFSLNKLPKQMPHLCVLPMLVRNTDGILKLVVLTTYSEDDVIHISGNSAESAIDVFDLDENVLIK